MEHTYDFYKPDLTSEYPIVDGHYSIHCYTQALDKCYQAYNVKCAKQQKRLANGLTNGQLTNGHKEEPRGIDRFASIAFHVPTCKVVQKSYARLLYNDYLMDKDHPAFDNLPQAIRQIEYQASLTDKTVTKTFMALTEEKYKQKIFPGMLCPRNIGNMYTASVYSSLASIISEIPSDELVGRRVGVFSYGSGLAASFFSIKVLGPVDHIAKALRVRQLLDERIKVSPEDHERVTRLFRLNANLIDAQAPRGDEGAWTGLYPSGEH
jgi:hydroxymethylglutaryl-CoA synthase